MKTTMNTVRNSVSKELKKHNFVVFAMLFGSFAEQRETNISDLDIGIYTSRDIDLLEIGTLVNCIEKIVKTRVDIVVLNNLYKKKPVLAYEIVSKGQLILCKNNENFIEFKKNTFLYYLDTNPLRKLIDKSFNNRINESRFGERNYVRKT